MGRFLSRAFSIFCLVASMAVIAADQNRNLAVASSNHGRVALVIGNASYPGVAALKNPANDANDIAAKLRKLDFDVTLKVNVGLKEMLRALTAFGSKVQPGSEVLVFYAGHGMQVRGRNYLIPIDAEIGNETAVSSESVDVDQLLDKLANARLSMVILDACRNNPFERRFRGYGQGLAQVNAPTGTLIAYSTAPGKVASDGDGRNGLYTQELLAALDVPGIRVEDVFKRVRVNVVKKSGESQTPWESSSLTGDFYFSTDGTTPASNVPIADLATIEIALWESIKNSSDPADYLAYLDKYPNGQFVGLADRRARSRLPTPGVAAAQQQSTGNDLKKDWATIYLLRASALGGSSVVWNVKQDDQPVGQLPNGSYFELKTIAGKHTFSFHPTHVPGQVSDSATYEIAPGKTYYLEYDLGGLFGDRTVQLISEEKGKEYLRTLRQTTSSVAQ